MVITQMEVLETDDMTLIYSNLQYLYHTNVCFSLSNIPKGKLFFSSRTPDIGLYYSVYSQQIQMYFISTSQSQYTNKQIR